MFQAKAYLGLPSLPKTFAPSLATCGSTDASSTPLRPLGRGVISAALSGLRFSISARSAALSRLRILSPPSCPATVYEVPPPPMLSQPISRIPAWHPSQVSRVPSPLAPSLSGAGAGRSPQTSQRPFSSSSRRNDKMLGVPDVERKQGVNQQYRWAAARLSQLAYGADATMPLYRPSFPLGVAWVL